MMEHVPASASDPIVLSDYVTSLPIELVPGPCWEFNLRLLLPPEGWELCKRFVRRRSGDRCEVCGGRGRKWPVECHEVWGYDDDRHVQHLRGLVALCPDCHAAKHPGFAGTQGRLEQTLSHYARVNGVSTAQARRDYTAAMATFEERSRHDWDLDISWLAGSGVFGPARAADDRRV